MTPSELAQKLKPYSNCPLLEARWILQKTTNIKKINQILKRRKNSEPLSKILKCKSFWKYDFITNKDVLDPRADSEILIQAVLDLFPEKNAPYQFADIGTGSGCLLLSLLGEYKNAKGFGFDISLKALNTAKKNAKHLNIKAHFIKRDMRQIDDSFDFAVSNPPYIPTKDIEKLDKNVLLYDPISALDGGEDGLYYYRILSQKTNIPVLFLEIGKGQKTAICKIFKKQKWQFVKQYKDYGKIIRVLVFQKNTCKSK